MPELTCWMCGSADNRDALNLMPVGAGDERDHVLVCLVCLEESNE